MTANTDPLFGKRIDCFVAEELLGRGGMGRVYRAWHRTLGIYAAIKIIEPAFQNDPAYAERFRREAHNISRLRRCLATGGNGILSISITKMTSRLTAIP